MLMLFDNRANLHWTRVYPGLTFDAAAEIPGHGFVMAGKGFAQVDFEGRFIRANADGDTLWTRIIDTHSRSEFKDVVVVDDDFVAAGTRFSDYFISKIDSAGNLTWWRIFDLADDQVNCLCRTRTGGFVMAGRSDNWDTYESYMMLAAVSDDGDSLWSWISPDSGIHHEELVDVIETIDGGIVAVGLIEEGIFPEGGPTDVILLKWAPNGHLEWRRTYGEPGLSEWGRSVIQLPDGGFAIGAIVEDLGEYYTDMFVIRTERDPSLDAGSGAPRLVSFSLLQNYPNPFNAGTVIPFELSRGQFVSLTVYDVTGRMVRTIVNEPMSAGRHAVSFDAAGLASGIYLYRLEADGLRETRKMVMVR